MNVTIKLNTKMVQGAADEANMTMEKFVGMIRSISMGRNVCAHFKGTDGADSVFVCI